jgi:hypothetical protein
MTSDDRRDPSRLGSQLRKSFDTVFPFGCRVDIACLEYVPYPEELHTRTKFTEYFVRAIVGSPFYNGKYAVLRTKKSYRLDD